MSKIVKLSEVVGKGYKKFWHSRATYVAVKGSRASKKSKTTALWHIHHMMKYPLANILCVRQVGNTLKDSVYADLKWAIHRLGVDHLFKCTLSPLEITYLPSGTKILFRGMDDPLKITSISVDIGVLCWCWVEEAYQILIEEDFNMLDESIRGQLPEGYFKRMTLTFNPWSAHSWLKPRFFDVIDDNVLAMTTTYECNEWLSDTDLRLFEDMKKRNPKRYKVAGEGEWGIEEGQIFDNWTVEDLTDMIPSFASIYHGLDFGATDPNALVCFDVEMGQKKIYIFDEYYEGNITLDKLAKEVSQRIGNRFVTCDSAGKQHIIELNNRGIWALPAIKGADSITHGIQWLQGFDIIIHKDCKNFIKEISSYCWAKDKFGKSIDTPVDENNHLIDALRYGCEPLHAQGQLQSAKRIT
jgi:phage terminase large subunit